ERRRRPRIEDRERERAEIALLLQRTRRRILGRGVAEGDVVDVDMAPAAGFEIDDLQDGFLVFEIADLPVIPFKLLLVLAGGRAAYLAVHLEVDALTAGEVAAADLEIDVRPFDREFRRRKRAGRLIAAYKRVNQILAAEASDLLLIGQGAHGRLIA